MANFTPTQGRYLSFIQAYTQLHGCAPAESEIAAAMCVMPPSVNQMVMMLERKGLISRQPGMARSIRILVPADEIPSWRGKGSTHSESMAASRSSGERMTQAPPEPAVNLYVLRVFLMGGPTPKEFSGKEISRVIEIRGDQTLQQLHEAIFLAYDRWDEHPYQFQFGSRPFDPAGPNYAVPAPGARSKDGDARAATLDSLKLTERPFGYWFDFGDDWFHQIQVEKVVPAIPTVEYPRVTRRVGKSPPQYYDFDAAPRQRRSKPVNQPQLAKHK